MARLTKEQASQVRQAICDAVWTSIIDQWSTKEVAEKFGCSEAFALRILHSIIGNTSGDGRFIPNPDRNGMPILADGRTFCGAPVDTSDNGSYSNNGKAPFKYIWFAD